MKKSTRWVIKITDKSYSNYKWYVAQNGDMYTKHLENAKMYETRPDAKGAIIDDGEEVVKVKYEINVKEIK